MQGAGAQRRHERRRLAHLPGLDGLRAVAVLAVVLYHAGVSWIPGGFLGVDVFFVISGFLISLLLLDEVDRAGRVDLRGFWARRARRLLPALYAVLAAVVLWMLVAARGELGGLRGDLVAALTYVTNWFQIAAGRSYFEHLGRPSPLRHLWSLAVEEQFYVLWPLVFGGLLRRRVGRRALAIGLGVATLASTGLMAALFRPSTDPSRVYFGTDTRAAPLLVGALLAVVWGPSLLDGRGARRVAGPGTVVLGAAAFAPLAAVAATTGDRAPWLYRGGFLLVAVLAAGLVVAASVPGAVAQVASWAPLQWLGTRSYAVYLWHWPVVVFTRPGEDVALRGTGLLVLRLAATAALAELSWRFVEGPVKDGVIARWWVALQDRRDVAGRRRAVGALGAGVVGALSITTAVMAVPQVDDPITASIKAGQKALALGTPSAAPIALAPVTAAAPKPPGTTRPAPATSVPPGGPGAAPAATGSTAPAAPPAPTAPTAPPTTLPRPAYQYAIPSSAFGDSVMLGSAPALKKTFGPTLRVDARVSRQFSEGLRHVAAAKAAGKLGDVVIVHLGNNGPFSAKQLGQMLDLLKDVPAVFLVTVHVPFGFRSTLNGLMAEGAASRANVGVIDWNSAANANGALLYKDGIHMSGTGSLTYAQLLASAIIGVCVGNHPNPAGAPAMRLDRCTARVPASALTTTTKPPATTTTAPTTTTTRPAPTTTRLPAATSTPTTAASTTAAPTTAVATTAPPTPSAPAGAAPSTTEPGTAAATTVPATTGSNPNGG